MEDWEVKFGRPTLYTEETLQASLDYINGGYEALGHVIPSIVGLAKAINRSRTTIYDWKDDPEKKVFSDIVEFLMDEQLIKLQSGGLENTYSGSIVKLLMTKHGFSDKQDQQLSGPGGGPIEHDHEWRMSVHEVSNGDS